MKVVKQSHEILSLPDQGLKLLEKAGRTCYKSENRITDSSSEKFVKMLCDHGHHAMIEFGDIIVKFITNRGVTHELVRHRHCSFAQESTRYVKYAGEMKFIEPIWWDTSTAFQKKVWYSHMKDSEFSYIRLLDTGWKAQQAREVLPNSLKTEIVVKANIREWMHVLDLRCSPKAHPQIVALMKPLLVELHQKIPVVFDLLYEKYITTS